MAIDDDSKEKRREKRAMILGFVVMALVFSIFLIVLIIPACVEDGVFAGLIFLVLAGIVSFSFGGLAYCLCLDLQ